MNLARIAKLLKPEVEVDLDTLYAEFRSRNERGGLDADAALLEAPVPRFEPGGPSTLGALLHRSTARLSSSTKARFAALSLLPAGVAFDLDDLGAIWGLEGTHSAVRDLTASGLIEAVETGTFRLHPVLRAWSVELKRRQDSGRE